MVKDKFDLSIVRKVKGEYWISIQDVSMNKGVMMKMDLDQIIRIRNKLNQFIEMDTIEDEYI